MENSKKRSANTETAEFESGLGTESKTGDKAGLGAEVLSKVASAVAGSGFLATKELGFHLATSTAAAAAVGGAGEKLRALLNRTLGHVTAAPGKASFFAAPDDVVVRFDAAVDAVDCLLERADNFMDTASANSAAARKARLSLGNTSNSNPSTPSFPPALSAFDSPASSTKRAVLRPQLSFADIVDNSPASPWIRKLSTKHNAIVPLSESLAITVHPYLHEITELGFPEKVWTHRPEILYSSLDETPFTFVDSVAQFDTMLAILLTVDEIAIDLEHHDYRSFQGFTCLIQISTRHEDFIVDALVLRSHLPQLNIVLSNPNVIKVLHGAESDIIWLQRDFGCYIVGLFDTYHASHVLELEGHGLAFLLKWYCGVETNKKFQLADWRIRPISKEMIKYARIDTHYLLYIYDRMRNEVLDKDLDSKQFLRVVLDRSKETSLRVYEKEVYDSENGEGYNGWSPILRKSSISLTPIQTSIFKALHAWRDRTARVEDESVRYVCPNHILLQIAVALPTDLKTLSEACHPIMPNLIKVYAQEVLLVAERARVAAVETVHAKEVEALAVISRGKDVGNSISNAVVSHLRFNDGPADVVASVSSGLAKKRHDVVASGAARSTPFVYQKIVTNIIVKVKEDGIKFATFMAVDKNGRGLEKAEAIRASLYLIPPTFAKKRLGADEIDSEDAGPSPKKLALAQQPPKKPAVTKDTVVAVSKSKTAPVSASQAIKIANEDAELLNENKLKSEKKTIPALPGDAYTYPTDGGVFAANEQEGGSKGTEKEFKKVFNPYGVTNTAVDGYKGHNSGQKRNKK
ncbi:exosome nuclease subunit [Physocladia obscura]|uniref:Exosome nuclease subunit n=1 Tax=Physocladia obscura TaxID=109957 RepID=A0AAD5SRT2_9FUNG|nr:exosome nuclease subunit [Physocladia obscura]